VVYSSNFVFCCCMIAGKSLCVLYDSGATHSFMLESYMQELDLLVCELYFDLVVSTLTSSLVRTLSVCARCLVEVEGRMFKVNLICLPLQGINVILGMD